MPRSLTRTFRLPLSARERELLLGFGVENLDLARRLRRCFTDGHEY